MSDRMIRADDHVAVIDVGNTNIKLCVVDGDGATLSTEVRRNTIGGTPPYPHVDVDGLWDWLIGALRRAATQFPITAIVPTTYAATCALIGAQGELLLPVLHHSSDAIAEVDAAYEARARDFRKTGSPRLPFGQNLGRQLFWQSRKFPETFAKVRTMLTYPQYWSWRLSGVAASEVSSLGAHSDLWNPRDQNFSRFAVDMGWNKLFPPMHPAWAKVGPIKPDIAAATGLPADCRVHNGVHDSNASYLRHLVGRTGEEFTVVSTGTWIISFAAGRPTDRLDETRDTLANVDVLGVPVACSRFMGGHESERIVGEPQPSRTAGEAEARQIIEQGSMALPSFAPEVGPFQGRVGKLVGPPPRNQAQRAALASLYCALVTDECLSLIDARGDLIIEGAFTQNTPFCRLLAALRPQQRAVVSDDTTGTVAGASLLAHWPPDGERALLQPCAPPDVSGLHNYRQLWLEHISTG